MRFIPSGTRRRHAQILHMDMGQTFCGFRTFTSDILPFGLHFFHFYMFCFSGKVYLM